MTDTETPNLSTAWALETADDSIRLYSKWASSYDQDFATAHAYDLPRLVAQHYGTLGGGGQVLDVGAGTGLVAEELKVMGIAPVHGVDISREMLDVARGKNLYEELQLGNILGELSCATASYDGCVSAGTFTLGHVGPEGLDEVIRILKPGGIACISIHSKMFGPKGFESALKREEIKDLTLLETPIYAVPASHPYAQHTAFLVGFKRQ